MRTDKQQLELIYEKAAIRLGVIKKRRRIAGMVLSVALCAITLIAVSLFAPSRPDISEVLGAESHSASIEDNVIVGQSSETESDKDEGRDSTADSHTLSSEEACGEESILPDVEYSSSESEVEQTESDAEASSEGGADKSDSSEDSSEEDSSVSSNADSLPQSDAESSSETALEESADDIYSSLPESSVSVEESILEPFESEESTADFDHISESSAESVESSEMPEDSSRIPEDSDEAPAESTESTESSSESYEESTDVPTLGESASPDESSESEDSSEENVSTSGSFFPGEYDGPPTVSQPPEESGGSDSSAESTPTEPLLPPLPEPEAIHCLVADEFSDSFFAELERAEASIPLFVHMPYRDNLGTALAWQLYMSVKTDFYYYNTVLSFEGVGSEAELLAEMTALEVTPIAYAYLEGGTCYAMLDSLSVVKLASGGVYCYALGSGYDTNEISTDTDKGISAFCNMYGDLYVADDRYVDADVIKSYYLNN